MGHHPIEGGAGGRDPGLSDVRDMPHPPDDLIESIVSMVEDTTLPWDETGQMIEDLLRKAGRIQ